MRGSRVGRRPSLEQHGSCPFRRPAGGFHAKPWAAAAASVQRAEGGWTARGAGAAHHRHRGLSHVHACASGPSSLPDTAGCPAPRRTAAGRQSRSAAPSPGAERRRYNRETRRHPCARCPCDVRRKPGRGVLQPRLDRSMMVPTGSARFSDRCRWERTNLPGTPVHQVAPLDVHALAVAVLGTDTPSPAPS